MIGRKTVVSLSLLGTLCLCALTAQSALAVPGWEGNTNTTTYECVSGGGTKDFADAHCDTTVGAGTGSFGHVAISHLSTPSITMTNQTTKNKTAEATDTVLEGISKGESVKLTVKEVHGLGTIKNIATEMQHQVEGSITLEYNTIVVDAPAKCSAKKSESSLKFKGVKTPNGEMGLEFTPAAGTVLLTIELSGVGCPQAGTKLEFKGSMVATGGAGAAANESGATWVFAGGGGYQSLEMGGFGASITGTLTLKESGVGPAFGMTTVTK